LRPLPRLGRYAPESTLVLPVRLRSRAAEPAIDVHAHLGRWLTGDGSWMERDVDALLRSMDGCNVRAIVNLDGRWERELDDNLERYDRRHPGRFATFCQANWELCRTDRFDALVADLERSIGRGAHGLKVWKDLGRTVRDGRGDLVMPDDDRLTPMWSAAARAGIPVLIHTADPVAFFRPIDRRNERLEELRRFPGSSWCQPELPSHQTLMDAFEKLVSSNPATQFIAAHAAGWTENLGWVEQLLDRNPNVSIDIAGRVADLGRQPRATAALIARHPDRVLFGSDVFPWRPAELAIYFRFLETADEHFAYTVGDPPPFGRWTISGLELDPATLAAVYAGNAQRLLPRL
jgi:predicted TIM-barrel fold metal-dependent hydrolase